MRRTCWKNWVSNIASAITSKVGDSGKALALAAKRLAATYELMALLMSRAIRRDVAKALERFKYRLEQDSTPSLTSQSPLDAVP